MRSKQTDNHNLAAKLALRRYFLRKYHAAAPFSVVDCFSGGLECLWTTLRAEFPVADYLALDLKPKRGRLKLDSMRYLENQKWAHDVIDLDAYGSPWKHWIEVLKRGLAGTVFVTVGNSVFGRQDSTALAFIGLTFDVPIGLHKNLGDLIVSYALAAATTHGFTIAEIVEAPNPNGRARYLGIRLERTTNKCDAPKLSLLCK